MSVIKLIRTLVMAAVAWASLPAFAESLPDVRSAVFVLVDVSKTWLNMASATRNEAVLKSVNRGVLALSKRIERASFVAYGQIGDQAVTQTLICSANYQPTLLTLAKGTTLRKEDELREFLGSCVKPILDRSPAAWTDISGSLSFVSRQLGDNKMKVTPYVIVVSDMKEERGSKGPVELNLKGFKVLLVYRALPEDDKKPNELETRLKTWRDRLTKFGATVATIIDTGLVEQEIAKLAGDAYR